MRYDKSLCAAVTICFTLVNIQTHRQTSVDQLIWKAQSSELKRCYIVLFTIRKSHMGFQSVLKAVTLSDLERPSGHHYAWFYTIWHKPTGKLTDCRYQTCRLGSLVFGNIWFMWDVGHYLRGSWASCYILRRTLSCTFYDVMKGWYQFTWLQRASQLSLLFSNVCD